MDLIQENLGALDLRRKFWGFLFDEANLEFLFEKATSIYGNLTNSGTDGKAPQQIPKSQPGFSIVGSEIHG